jgi:hypothetical protein
MGWVWEGGLPLPNGVWGKAPINLGTAVRSTHLAQPIDSPGISGKNLITNKMTAIFPDTPDKSIDCTMHALPVAVSRIKPRNGG